MTYAGKILNFQTIFEEHPPPISFPPDLVRTILEAALSTSCEYGPDGLFSSIFHHVEITYPEFVYQGLEEDGAESLEIFVDLVIGTLNQYEFYHEVSLDIPHARFVFYRWIGATTALLIDEHKLRKIEPQWSEL